MDTEGTMDNQNSSNIRDSLLSAFSLLVSSVQIVNVQAQMSKHDLDCLQVSVQYRSF